MSSHKEEKHLEIIFLKISGYTKIKVTEKDLYFSILNKIRGSLNRFPSFFFVWALLLIVHT